MSEAVFPRQRLEPEALFLNTLGEYITKGKAETALAAILLPLVLCYIVLRLTFEPWRKRRLPLENQATRSSSGLHRASTQEELLPIMIESPNSPQSSVAQPWDVFLVVDVEGTCVESGSFDYPNEIIEWPVCLLRWSEDTERRLEIVDEFRSFVRPSWRPQISAFCTSLTSITQQEVDAAPTFSEVMKAFEAFLNKHGLIDSDGQLITRTCWCSDGPWDLAHFFIKQLHISKMKMPSWMRTDFLDIRKAVAMYRAQQNSRSVRAYNVRNFGISHQLGYLGLEAFQGRQHCGIDDARNISRILIELANRNVRLVPNATINPNRRWNWMGKKGVVIEDALPNNL